MPKKSKTSYFTKRGKHFGNLWATYSVKAGRVLLLGSDRQLAHWLLNLEFSPTVVDFTLRQEAKGETSYEASLPEYHFQVRPVEGSIELHFLRLTGNSASHSEKVKAAGLLKYKYVEFNDDDWVPRKTHIMPLLRVINFLNAGRNAYVPPGLLERSVSYVYEMRQGSLLGFLTALSAYEQNLGLLVFCRLYSERRITVEFERDFFSQDTWWCLNEE